MAQAYEEVTRTVDLDVRNERLLVIQQADEGIQTAKCYTLENLVLSGADGISGYMVLSDSEPLNVKTACTRSVTGGSIGQLDEDYCANENYVVDAVGEGCSLESCNEDPANEQPLLFESSSSGPTVKEEAGLAIDASGCCTSELMTESGVLSSGMVVLINGESCVLQLDPHTGHFLAYPTQVESGDPSTTLEHTSDAGEMAASTVVTAVSEITGEIDLDGSSSVFGTVKLSEQENNAAEGLLGLAESQETSDAAPSLSLHELNSTPPGIDSVTKTLNVDADSVAANANHISASGQQLSMKVEQLVSCSAGRNDEYEQVADGEGPSQTVYASSNRVQNFLASLGLPVKRGRGRPRRNPLPPNTTLSTLLPAPGSKGLPLISPSLLPKLSDDETQTSIIIEQEDGTEKHIILSMPARKAPPTISDAVPHHLFQKSVVKVGHQKYFKSESNAASINTLTDVSSVSESTTNSQVAGSCEMNIKPELSNEAQLVFVVKKDPPKIGLRATERDLAKLKCVKCDYQAYYPQQLQQHLNDSHADQLSNLIHCKCCTFLCFDEETLLTHFRASHPKCICKECNFTSEHPYAVKRHMQRHDLNGCECYICGRRYKDQYILKMHIKMRHMEPDVLFQCNVCSKLFSRKAHLKRHLRIHNPNKPYKCPHCEYRGCERSDITKHILIHETPRHACHVCGKSFRHIKNKELHMKRHRGQRDYKCVCCDFYGYTFTDIRKHQERKHAGLVIVACNVCGSTFKSEHLLQIHQQTECSLVTTVHATADEAQQTSDLLQYVSHGGAVQLEIDPNLMAADGQVMINQDQVAMDSLAEEGNDGGLSVVSVNWSRHASTALQ